MLGKEWNNFIWNSLLYLDVILFLPCTIFNMFTTSAPVCATYCLFCFAFQVEGGKTNLRNCRPRNLWNRRKLRNLKKWLFFLQLPLTNVIKQFVTIYFLPWLNDFFPADWSRAIVDNSTDHWKLSSICLITLIESSGSETESPRIADFRLVSSRRKETRGIDLNTVGWEENEGINGACRHFSWPLYIHHAVRTECLRPPQIYSHYKRIIPSLT